ncbi:hypothetical protein [Pseudonocardia sp.]|uniref:hypothetical protein n=1 Tax=Pseudonocardia sp. TaxID=60912 RepID=UPI002625CD9E|nr:hypothetical protein [Pseudonocardia sp.]
MDIDHARLVTRRELLAHGFDDGEIRGRKRRGELITLRRGAYAAAGALPERPEDRHAAQVRVAVRQVSPDAVVSHLSAAVLYGFPVWGDPLRRVQMTRSRRSGARVTDDLHVHAAPLDPWELVTVDGITVTSVARTLVDVGRHVGFEQAVVVADAAMWRQVVTREELDVALAAAHGRPGVPAARRALAFARWGSESVGESRSRVAMLHAGIPAPILQWEVRTAGGLLLGRTDFGWPQYRTFGEFDGREKYGRLVPPGRTAGDIVYAEKRREDAMRDEGLGAVRWGWTDLDPFTPTATRLRRTFRAA